MNILSVVGARPQFIKAAAVSCALRTEHAEILVHTGQHYDHAMSRAFFEGLNIPEPDYDLEVGSGSHAEQTAGMLKGLEHVLLEERPDLVLVYGDTNSTLAGALAAVKLSMPLAHVEAGLRSFNRAMPEEINRVLTDCVSALLLCPTPTSIENLHREGIRRGVHLVGDVMFDVAARNAARAEATSKILEQLDVEKKEYLLATVHRAENTDDPRSLTGIIEALGSSGERVVLPLHPRTRKCIERCGLTARLDTADNVVLTEPLGYLDFVMLEKNARKILTDSGGVQKEACFHRVPCITMREETEWTETVDCGWNVLVGADRDRILNAIREPFENPTVECEGTDLWDGCASQRIVEVLRNHHDWG